MMPVVHSLYLSLPAFIIVAAASGLWFRALLRVAIPPDRKPYVVAWIGGGGLGIAALALSESGDLSRMPAWFAVCTAGIFLFTVAISKQVLGSNAIRVGDRIPSFTAIDEHGQPFGSRDLHGHLLLIKFFRAHW